MSPPRILPAAVTLALALSAAASAAPPLPYGSLNPAARATDFGQGALVETPLGAGCSGDLCLTVTLALADPADPQACGNATSLDVILGDEVNVCYTLTNHSASTLNYHTLVDGDVGTLLTNYQQAVPPHSSFQYNRVVVATTSQNATTGDFTSTWTASEALPVYSPSTATPQAFVDISATGTPLVTADGASLGATAPFPLNFYGTTYTSLCVGNNGGLMLGVTDCVMPYINRALPATQLSGPSVLPYWDALHPTGSSYYGTVGTAPNRQFVVSWHDKANRSFDANGQHGATFEVIFTENDPTLTFVYRTATFGGPGAPADNAATATVGVQQDPIVATEFSFNTASLSDGMAITWSLDNPGELVATADATLAVGAPVVDVSPSPAVGLTPVVLAGTLASESLTISNLGDRPLDWSWLPPAARSHFPTTDRTAIEAFMRSPAGQALTSPAQRGRIAAKPRGGGDVIAYGLRNRAPNPDFVSFDVNDATSFSLIRENQPWTFAADFARDDFTKQYGITAFDGNPRLYATDTQTGEPTLIAQVPIPTSIFAYGGAWDPTTETMYVSATSYANTTSTLYTVDLATGDAVEIGTIANRLLNDIAVRADGLMYGLDVQNDVLVAIDKTTAEAQPIGPTGLSLWLAQGLDFDDRTGTLYAATLDSATNPAIYTLDTMTGQATLVSPSFGEIGGFSIANAAQECATPANTSWLSFGQTGGTVLPAASSATAVDIDASALTPGSYHASLCVYSNDPAQPRLTIPLALTVTENTDLLFRDGFDP